MLNLIRQEYLYPVIVEGPKKVKLKYKSLSREQCTFGMTGCTVGVDT